MDHRRPLEGIEKLMKIMANNLLDLNPEQEAVFDFLDQVCYSSLITRVPVKGADPKISMVSIFCGDNYWSLEQSGFTKKGLDELLKMLLKIKANQCSQDTGNVVDSFLKAQATKPRKDTSPPLLPKPRPPGGHKFVPLCKKKD